MGNHPSNDSFNRSCRTLKPDTSYFNEIVWLCDEANELGCLPHSGIFESNNTCDGSKFWRFIPLVHYDLLKPQVRQQLREKNHGLNTDRAGTCTANDIERHRPLILFPNNRKIIIAIEEMTKSQSAGNVDSALMTVKASLICKKNIKFATYAEFLTILGYLRNLKILLATGSKPNMIDSCSHVRDSMKNVHGSDSKYTNIQKPNQSLDLVTDGECLICMDADVEILLPCVHGFCSSCAKLWIESHNDCPVCRMHMSNNDFQCEQWQMETWSQADTADQVTVIGTKLESQYEKIGTEKEGNWSRENVEKDFLHLTSAPA
mmetsp:Transcript_28444/g.41349  ORF Transcript_28444/g.41349 Transcript_28444/m.41349 type:complete len:318 (-) Transcript_28444:916-1869(-)